MKYFTIERFGTDVPVNYEEILEALNWNFEWELDGDESEKEVKEAVESFWEKYCDGSLNGIPEEQWWSIEFPPFYEDDTYNTNSVKDCIRWLKENDHFDEPWRLVLVSIDHNGCVTFAHEIIEKDEL